MAERPGEALLSDEAGPRPLVFDVQDLHRHFRLEKHRIDVLRGVSFSVSAGEWVALVGRSGSGKTTLLHLLGGLDAASTGEVWVDGRSLTGLGERERSRLRNQSLGFIYQLDRKSVV